MPNHFLKELEISQVPTQIFNTIKNLYQSYLKAVGNDASLIDPLFFTFLSLIKKEIDSPSNFDIYHKRLRYPFDYYQFGLDMLKPLVDLENSSFRGEENLNQINKQLESGHNVIFLANHQTEADPVCLSLLIKDNYPQIEQDIIFVAGARVTTDPLAVPTSLGCNLLCIYSKKYMDHPPELKEQKQFHNKKTMQKMGELLSEGRKCIYVAPSGGRDRTDKNGVVQVDKFDPRSIELFNLIAKKANKPTHFYTLSLSTYNIMPPPQDIQIKLGEDRSAHRSPIHFFFGPEVDLENFPGSSEAKDKEEKMQKRAEYLWNVVASNYALIS